MSVFAVLDWQLNDNYGGAAQEHLGKVPLMLDPSKPIAPEVQMEPFWNLVEPDAGWTITADGYLFGPAYEAKAPAAMARIPGGLVYVWPHHFVAIVSNTGAYALGRLKDA